MLLLFTIHLLFLNTGDVDGREDSSPTGSEKSFGMFKHDGLIWYAKNNGKLIEMLNIGRQINRIVKKDGHLSRISKDDGLFKILRVENMDKIICWFSEQRGMVH